MPAPGTHALRAIRETLIHAVSLDPAIRDDDLRVLVQALLHMGDDLRATLEWSSWDIGQGDLREAMRRLRDCGLIRVHEETDADQVRGWTVWIAPEFLELRRRRGLLGSVQERPPSWAGCSASWSTKPGPSRRRCAPSCTPGIWSGSCAPSRALGRR